MFSIKCKSCSQEAWLKDAGFDQVCNKFFRVFVCENKHETVERFTKEEMKREQAAEKDDALLDRLERMLEELEEESRDDAKVE